MRSNQISRLDAYKKLLETEFYNGTTDTYTLTLKLAKEFGVSTKKVATALAGLISEGILATDKSGRNIRHNVSMKTGVFHDSKGKGKYGFITVDGYEKDLYIPDAGNAKEGDIVELSIIGRGEGEEPKAVLSKVLERKTKNLIGVVRKTTRGYVFKPDGEAGVEYYIAQNGVAKDAEGKKCSLEVAQYADTNSLVGTGIIRKTFGFAEDPIAENRAIAYQYGFSKEFPQEVMDEVAKIPQEVTSEDMQGRLDLRHLPFTAWDPASCKDKDDAMYVEKTATGYKVYVAIADVGHYVKPGSAIDREAYKRGTSCYLGDGVYPMFPPELSNGICSLNEGVDRLAHVAIVDIDEKGKILDFGFKKSVIHVKKSLAYEEAEAIHTGELVEGYEDIKKDVDLLYEAHKILAKKLEKQGAISFKSKEPTFSFNEDRTGVVDVLDKGADESHAVVESMMLLANVSGALYLKKNKIDGLYRVHEGPREDKIATVNSMLKVLGIDHTLEPNNYSYQQLTKKLSNSKYEDFLTSLALRSMSKAKYQPEDLGHFGLAQAEVMGGYLHFTSPIRRYPDLVVHRAIASCEQGLTRPYSKKKLEEMGEYLSMQERQAEFAEVESDKVLCAYWAKGHIGETFDGYISKLSQDSISARIGLVDVTIPTMCLEGGEKADYKLNKAKTAIFDKNTGKVYRLADDISLKIAQADVSNKMIFGVEDFTQTLENNEVETQVEDYSKPKTASKEVKSQNR